MPTPADFKLGAGDEIILSLWGEVNSREKFIVNKEGLIYYKNIGFINLSNKTIKEAEDLLINKSLQTQLLLDQSINFINFSVDTVNGVVYIFGIARDQEEINRIIKHARNINYVENIINYMSVGNH